MSMLVQVSTDQAPELLDLIERRREHGLDTYDEWWEGVYLVVTGPSYEHGLLIGQLAVFLIPLAEPRGLTVPIPINIGVDKFDARVPDMAVVRPDTERTSRAFFATAELVVEILSPGEKAGAKLGFYAAWHVREYLEIDLAGSSARLLANRDGEWEPIEVSEVLGFAVADVESVVASTLG